MVCTELVIVQNRGVYVGAALLQVVTPAAACPVQLGRTPLFSCRGAARNGCELIQCSTSMALVHTATRNGCEWGREVENPQHSSVSRIALSCATGVTPCALT